MQPDNKDNTVNYLLQLPGPIFEKGTYVTPFQANILKIFKKVKLRKMKISWVVFQKYISKSVDHKPAVHSDTLACHIGGCRHAQEGYYRCNLSWFSNATERSSLQYRRQIVLVL